MPLLSCRSHLSSVRRLLCTESALSSSKITENTHRASLNSRTLLSTLVCATRSLHQVPRQAPHCSVEVPSLASQSATMGLRYCLHFALRPVSWLDDEERLTGGDWRSIVDYQLRDSAANLCLHRHVASLHNSVLCWGLIWMQRLVLGVMCCSSLE